MYCTAPCLEVWDCTQPLTCSPPQLVILSAFYFLMQLSTGNSSPVSSNCKFLYWLTRFYFMTMLGHLRYNLIVKSWESPWLCSNTLSAPALSPNQIYICGWLGYCSWDKMLHNLNPPSQCTKMQGRQLNHMKLPITKKGILSYTTWMKLAGILCQGK